MRKTILLVVMTFGMTVATFGQSALNEIKNLTKQTSGISPELKESLDYASMGAAYWLDMFYKHEATEKEIYDGGEILANVFGIELREEYIILGPKANTERNIESLERIQKKETAPHLLRDLDKYIDKFNSEFQSL